MFGWVVNAPANIVLGLIKEEKFNGKLLYLYVSYQISQIYATKGLRNLRKVSI